MLRYRVFGSEGDEMMGSLANELLRLRSGREAV